MDPNMTRATLPRPSGFRASSGTWTTVAFATPTWPYGVNPFSASSPPGLSARAIAGILMRGVDEGGTSVG